MYRGLIQQLQGNHFFGDFVSERIWSLKVNDDAPSEYDGTNFTDFTDWTELLVPDVGEINLIVSFGEDVAANLYIVDYTGEVFRVTPVSDSLSVSSVDDADTVGLVSVNPDGTVLYDPNGKFTHLGAGQTATDTFTYTIADSAITDERTAITIDVFSGDVDKDAGDLASQEMQTPPDALVLLASSSGLSSLVDVEQGDVEFSFVPREVLAVPAAPVPTTHALASRPGASESVDAADVPLRTPRLWTVWPVTPTRCVC